MARKLTAFDRMWNVYPAPVGEAAEAKAAIGGGVNVSWIDNTCVIRISRCFNYAGHPIPAGYQGFETVRGADGMRYGYRVKELFAYLTATYGPPAVSEERDPPKEQPPEAFLGKKGIVCFRVEGWSDATGHFDLWDGSKPRHQQYFGKASAVMLWPVESDGTLHLAAGTTSVQLTGAVGPGAANKPEDVARVQALLTANAIDVGPADGLLGPRTTQGIVDFQSALGHGEDGRVDPGGRTWRALNGL